MKEFEVSTDDIGMRADVFVAAKYPEFTRSSLEGLFDNGQVLIDDKLAKPSHKIRDGQKVTVDEELIRRQPEDIELPVIYEDDDVVVIDKPSGVLTHSKGALNHEATVASFIKPKLKDKSLSGNRAGIVHRLDRPTSGVIITGKSSEAVRHLQKQFSLRKAKKRYLAIVEGIPKESEAIIDAPILRNPRKPQSFIVDNAGKPANTHYKVIKSFKKGHKDYSLIDLRPQTGRTHQLRVHMAYIGHPIAGDPVYGHGDGQLMLQAKSLELTLPNKERKVFESKTPASIKEMADI
jgi:23S rRNA pseudouridine1911/1915/1917 synthase